VDYLGERCGGNEETNVDEGRVEGERVSDGVLEEEEEAVWVGEEEGIESERREGQASRKEDVKEEDGRCLQHELVSIDENAFTKASRVLRK
jgi:hypothetical protein